MYVVTTCCTDWLADLPNTASTFVLGNLVMFCLLVLNDTTMERCLVSLFIITLYFRHFWTVINKNEHSCSEDIILLSLCKIRQSLMVLFITHQMFLSKSKCWYSNNCLHFSKCAVPLHMHQCCLKLGWETKNRWIIVLSFCEEKVWSWVWDEEWIIGTREDWASSFEANSPACSPTGAKYVQGHGTHVSVVLNPTHECCCQCKAFEADFIYWKWHLRLSMVT